MTARTVGVVGAGRMGTAIVERLLDQGHPVLVADAASEARDRCAALGAEVAGSPGEVAARCEPTIVVVNTDQQSLDVVLGDDGILSGAPSGAVVVVHSTVHLDTLRTLVSAATARGVTIVDAGVTGGSDPARRGELAVLIGADADTVERIRPTVAAYASLIVHTGGPGTGMAAKHAVQTVLMGKLAATYEGLLLAHAAGVDVERFAEVVQHAEDASGIHAFVLGARARAMAGHEDPTWTQICTHQLPVACKDLDAAAALADELELPLAVTRAARHDMPAVWSGRNEGEPS